MKLLQQLNEASSLDLTDLKKAMSKDERIAGILKKNFTLSDVTDKDAFLSTLKYWVLNNDSVRTFVNSRSGVKDLSAQLFSELRSLRAKDLDDSRFEDIKSFISALFKEHTSTNKNTISAAAKKDITDWLNTNGYLHNISTKTQKELMSIPGIRPDKKIVVYRGLLFSENSLNPKSAYKTYDGTLKEPNGLKFLRAIRKGGTVVDLDWDKPSSWTTSKDVATRFAKFGPASSHTSAMLQWFDRQIKKQEIDGALGYVISALVDPEDILVDVNRISNSLSQNHGDEAEVILRPGTYTSKIVRKFTVHGEVDPATPEVDENSPAIKALSLVEKFKETFEIPKITKELFDLPFSGVSDLNVLRNKDMFKKLILNSTTTEAVHATDKLIDFYNKELHVLSDDDLSADKFVSDEETYKKIDALKKLLKRFTEKVTHSKFKDATSKSGKGEVHKLTGEELRTTIKSFDISALEKDLLTSGRIVSSDAARAFNTLARYLEVDLPSSAPISQFGAAKQQPIIDSTINKFFKLIDISKSNSTTENLKTMITLLRKANRNSALLQKLNYFNELLGEI